MVTNFRKNPVLHYPLLLFEKQNYNRNPNPLIQTAVHRSNIYYSKIYQKGNWKNIRFFLEGKKYDPAGTWLNSLHLKGRARYFRHRHSIKLYKNKMDAKIIKSHQCSPERSHAVFIELDSEF